MVFSTRTTLALVACIALIVPTAFGYGQVGELPRTVACSDTDSRDQCAEKGGFLAKLLWEEQIGVNNDKVQYLKESVMRASKALFASRTPGSWSKIRESRDQKWCPNDSYFELAPGTAASVVPNQAATWQGSCFQSMQAKLSYSGGSNYSLTVGGSQANSSGCSDTYLITTAYEILGVLDISTLDSSQTLPISVSGTNKQLDVSKNGVHIMFMPCGILGSIQSLVKTAGLFVGEGQSLLERNADFLHYKGIYPELKKFDKHVNIDKSNINSGDYLAIARFDGLDPMIMYGTGSVTGHSALAMWEGDQLYVTESTAADPFGKVYWPPPYGLIRIPWDRWIELAHNASYQVNILPLSEHYASKFDEDAYWTWFKKVEGMPYGFHNMLYSFMDTSNPERNFPAPIDNWVLQAVLNIWGGLFPPNSETSVYSLFVAALNHRTGQSCRTMECVTDWLVTHNKSIAEVTAIPEEDQWLYDNGQNYSMVCSAFAAHGWKVGLKGVIPEFTATEQTPKDNYQMNLFSATKFDESVCGDGLHTSVNGNYCQLMGAYWMELNHYNSIPLYSEMNNHCPSQWPDYFRCPASNPQCC